MSVTTTTQAAAGARAAASTLDRIGHRLQRLPLHVVIIAFCLIWVVPTVGMIINSFRSLPDMQSAGWWTTLFPPHGFTLASYQQVLNTEGVANSIITSVLITIPATVIQLAIATMGAYAFAWMQFPGKNIFFIVIVGLMVVPIQMTLIPLLQFFKVLGLNGTIYSVWLAHSGFGLPFEVFLLRNYLGGLPREIFESAEVDGAGHAVRFLRIAVPMTIPAIASLTIFVFLGV
jgi:alpha-glucoside transport system permease protein